MSSKRMKGAIAVRPIYFGNIAVPLVGKKAGDSDHTHKWTVMVGDVNNDDLSYYIKKVDFGLHETYPNPLRTVDQPPFEVQETGWGEFEISIKIHFQPFTQEKPISFTHHLRLHPYEEDENGKPWPKDKPVSSFTYDELVFNEPTEAFYEILSQKNALEGKLPSKSSSVPHFTSQREQEELRRLEKAQEQVNRQISELTDDDH